MSGKINISLSKCHSASSAAHCSAQGTILFERHNDVLTVEENRGFLKIIRTARLGERVCSLEDTMRMVKMKPKPMDLETVMQKFLLVKESQHTGEETMKDYRNCLARFLADSHNSLDYPLLENDVLTFFAAIPDTSPARYNKPFQNINAFLNWALEQELIEKNPIKVHKLHKRRDDGNIKPLPVDKLQAFLASLDKSTYTGLRDYVICIQEKLNDAPVSIFYERTGCRGLF